MELKHLIQVPLRNVKAGYESFIPPYAGSYLLFTGSGILASACVTYCGNGSIDILDVDPIINNGEYYWENKITRINPGKGIGYPIISASPPTPGFFSFNAGINNGLVVVVYGGEHENVPTIGIYYSPSKGKQ